MLYRLIISKSKTGKYMGVSFNGKKYEVIKNEHIGNYSKGSDISFYAKKESGFFKDRLIPISDEEAGVKNIINNKIYIESL